MPAILKHPDCLPSPVITEIIREIVRVADARNISYCAIGAQALALWLHGVYGRPMARISGDMDMAIAVSNWQQFADLKQALCQQAPFSEKPNQPHKLIYRPKQGLPLPVDFVPCGGVEQNGQILWPPDQSIKMNSAGFLEAVQHAELLQIELGLTVAVASLPSIALLKLLAWRDRHLQNSKDAADLAILAQRYEMADNLTRLYNDHGDLLEPSDYDPALASARMLARDLLAVATPASQNRLLDMIGTPDLIPLLQAQANNTAAMLAFIEQLEYELATMVATTNQQPKSKP